MVPHRKVLRALCLVAVGRRLGIDYALKRAEQIRVKFPTTVVDFMMTEVYPFLPVSLEAYLLTHDPAMNPDFRMLVRAAEELGVATYLTFTGEGPDLHLPGRVEHWREDDTVRMFVETALLAGIPVPQISADARQLWGVDVDEGDVHRFQALFVDPEYTRGEYWLNYAKCIGDVEATFKGQLMGQPQDFVRWKLGVPVALDSDRVLDRLISDAYFTERLIKSRLGQESTVMGKEHLNRIKMERDTIFKALDRKVKLKEAGGGTSGGETDAMREALEGLQLAGDPAELPTIDDLPGLAG